MKNINTRYGILEGITSVSYYDNNLIKECTLNKINNIKTPYGILIPQWDDSGERRKLTYSISFYKNGNLRSISLQNMSYINTPIGILPAELITFYEDESINRVFNLNGKISAYWTEEDEYKLADDIEFNLSVGRFRKKTIGIHFYNSGEVKSITFWPRDKITIKSPIGNVVTRIGLSFYKNGNLKSFEPSEYICVKTKIGNITAYDNNPLGVNGDSNSVRFSINGEIESLTTSTDKIEVILENGAKKVHQPQLKPSLLSEGSMEIVPLCIEFYENKVCFDKIHEYFVSDCTFRIGTKILKIASSCSNCAGCFRCG
ncbi:hypothetical protein [Clostridium thailandense]|uniref:hypothetical protein n=1 Tax=Clostridium thailandense TaxID=2794346 RepID=UPI003989316A